MIRIPNWTISCGARELILDKTTPTEKIIQRIKDNWFTPGFYFFAETKNKLGQTDTQAEQLVSYIKTHKLGTICETPEVKIRKVTKAWMWVVDREALLIHKIQEA